MGFGEYGEMCQDVGRYGERLLKIRDKFCQSIFSEDNLAFQPTILMQQKIPIECVLPTVGLGVFLENDGEGGKVWGSHAMQTI